MKNQIYQINEKPCIYWYSLLSLSFRLLIVHIILFSVLVVLLGLLGMLAQWFIEWRVAFPCYAVRTFALSCAIGGTIVSALFLVAIVTKEEGDNA
jgi:hypothetical protein